MRTIEGVEIFKSGDHVDSDGNSDIYYIDDLKEMVETYDPNVHEAPIVWGHDRDKAWHRKLTRKSQISNGWILKLYIVGDTLLADIEVDEDTFKAIEGRKLKKRSIGLYKPDSENNPFPGKYYVRHLALLGIEPPAIKGLKDIVIYSEFVYSVEEIEEEELPENFNQATEDSKILYRKIAEYKESKGIFNFIEAKRRYEGEKNPIMPDHLRNLVYKL